MKDENHEAENRESGKNPNDKSGKYIHVNDIKKEDEEKHSPQSEGGKMPEEETENLKDQSEEDKNQGKETLGIP